MIIQKIWSKVDGCHGRLRVGDRVKLAKGSATKITGFVADNAVLSNGKTVSIKAILWCDRVLY